MHQSGNGWLVLTGKRASGVWLGYARKPWTYYSEQVCSFCCSQLAAELKAYKQCKLGASIDQLPAHLGCEEAN